MDAELEILLETFDSVADTYGRILGLETVNRELLAPRIAEVGGRVLEVGCGPGEFARHYFRPDRHMLFALDFSEPMLHEAAAVFGDSLGRRAFPVRGLAGQLPFANDSFDAVACVNTLHNFPSWDHVVDALREMTRVLKPGGLLLAECRNIANSERRRITQHHDTASLPQKAYRFKEFRAAAESLGLKPFLRIALYGRAGALASRPRAIELPLADPRHFASPRFALLATKI